jgi:ferredoxin
VSTAVPTRRRVASLLRQAARLAERATTPLLPADYLDLVDPLRRGADLRGLEEAGLIRLVPRYSDVHGTFDVDALSALVPDLHERSTFACGPAGLLDALAAHHEARGLPLQTEQFRVATVAAGEGGTVTFGRSGTTVAADGATPILTAAEDAGVLMPSGCRMGISYGCVMPLREGAVRDLRTGAVTTVSPHQSHGGGVPIQTCINAAAGACDIDH